MRCLCCLWGILIIVFPSTIFSQTIVGKSFVVNVPDTKVYKIDAQNQKQSGASNYVYVKVPTKFTVIDLVAGGAIIKFWQYGEIEDIASPADKFTYEAVTAYIDSNADGKHFLMEMDDLDVKCSAYHGGTKSFTWGAVTIPIKIRFGDGGVRHFGVEPSANLGLFVGYRHQIPGKANHAFNFLGGTSIGSTTMRTVDFDKAVVEADTVNSYEGTGLVLSTTLGIVYQYDSFQIGLFTGLDFMTSDLGRAWHHQNVPWFGVGIGFGLFSKDKNENGTGGNK